MAIGELPIVEIAARIVVVIAVVCFAVLSHGLWATKASSLVHVADVQQSSQPPGSQKKKGNRTKKNNKKARGVPSAKSESNTGFEAELEAVKAQSLSDVEAPSLPNPSMDDAVSEGNNNDSEDEDLEMCTEKTISIGSQSCLVTSGKTSQVIHQLAEEDGSTCDMCSMPDMHIWGCPAHRTYTSQLLLAHCNIQRVIAQGPPGLDPLPANVSSSAVHLYSMQVR